MENDALQKFRYDLINIEISRGLKKLAPLYDSSVFLVIWYHVIIACR